MCSPNYCPASSSNIHVSPGVSVLHWCYLSILHVIPDPAFASLLYSFAYAAVCWIPMYVLYQEAHFHQDLKPAKR